jgi:hypothetical protein
MGFDEEVGAVETASARSGFGSVLRKARGLPFMGRPDDLVVAAATDDFAAVGRLLGPRDVNMIWFNETDLPESLVRRPVECVRLEVAVGSGSLELTKCLLEFHRARPTRETMKMAMSTGNLELIKLMRERLPETEFQYRVDLLEVAAEFHQPEMLTWLLRDATVFDCELLAVFALGRRLADSLVVAFGSGFRPWWSRTREQASKWRASSRLDFMSAPEGFSAEGGWWTDVLGVVSALTALGCEGGDGPTQMDAAHGGRSAFGGEWTKTMSQTQLGDGAVVKSIVFPVGVTAIGEQALRGFEVLESVVFPANCSVFDTYCLYSCRSLRAVLLQVGCTATGVGAFCCCSSLTSVTIPVGCSMISDWSFARCHSLRSVSIPNSCVLVGSNAFLCSGLRHVVIPEGCEIGKSAFQWCQSLATVTIGTGCTKIEDYAFLGCTVLALVALPSTLMSIGQWTFGNCPELATIAIPKGCRVNGDPFQGSRTCVTWL